MCIYQRLALRRFTTYELSAANAMNDDAANDDQKPPTKWGRNHSHLAINASFALAPSPVAEQFVLGPTPLF